jgi:hypothetical protein
MEGFNDYRQYTQEEACHELGKLTTGRIISYLTRETVDEYGVQHTEMQSDHTRGVALPKHKSAIEAVAEGDYVGAITAAGSFWPVDFRQVAGYDAIAYKRQAHITEGMVLELIGQEYTEDGMDINDLSRMRFGFFANAIRAYTEAAVYGGTSFELSQRILNCLIQIGIQPKTDELGQLFLDHMGSAFGINVVFLDSTNPVERTVIKDLAKRASGRSTDLGGTNFLIGGDDMPGMHDN